MEMNHGQFSAWFIKLATAEGMTNLSKKTGISRRTLYDLKAGAFPTEKTAARLGLEIVIRVGKKVV